MTTSEKRLIGHNIEVEIRDGKAILTIDLGRQGTASKSGKSLIIASTNGNVPLPGQESIILGLNAYVKR